MAAFSAVVLILCFQNCSGGFKTRAVDEFQTNLGSEIPVGATPTPTPAPAATPSPNITPTPTPAPTPASTPKPVQTGSPYASGTSLCSQSSFPYCESLESGALTAFRAFPGSTAAHIDIAPEAALRGTNGIHIWGKDQAWLSTDTSALASSNNQRLYGRLFVKFNSPFNTFWSHNELAYSKADDATGKTMRVSVQTEQDGTAYWGIGGVGGNSDWGIDDTHDGANATPIQRNKWICLEWMFDAPNTEFQLWTDGIEHTQLHVTNAILRNPPLNFSRLNGQALGAFYMPNLSMTNVGWGNNVAPGYDLYTDEIVLSPTRVGCAK
jgi:hypothetical protein